ncbi:MAG TPA: FAD-binding oxidoreductase [Candidatus Dormibacteraeota bacterium]|nr:FAD-binding oxidoreductase [Candidatus Dormibacteraeota bacterium]
MAKERVGVAIIGGGIVGCALAYYLAVEGESDILLLEAEEFGSGATGGSFGGVRQQFSTPLEVELSRRGLEFWRTAERRFGAPVPWHEDGYLFVTGQPAIMAGLEAAAELQRSLGLTDVHVLGPEQIQEVVPWIGLTGLLGGTYTPRDGRVTPTDGVAALVRAARARGVRHREHWRVQRLESTGATWRLLGPDVLEAEQVALCTGYWTGDLVRPFGLELPIRPVPLYSAITAPALPGMRVPLTLDLDTGFLVEREGAGLVIAVIYEENPPGYGHARMLEEFAELARVRAPSLADTRIARHVVANVDMGGDGHPYVGEIAPGLWMAAGFGGHGAMHGPPVAELLAKAMVGRPDPVLDIGSLDPWRTTGGQVEWMVAARKS